MPERPRRSRNYFCLTRSRLTLAAMGVLALATGALVAGEPYARVSEPAKGVVTLEMCTRTFVSLWAEDAPRVRLVSAVHVGDRSYYQAMQDQLDGYDVVLYEGVKPAGLDPIAPDLSDQAKASATRDRLGLLLQIADRYNAAHGEPPASFDALRESDDARIAAIVGSLGDDGWGNPIAMSVVENNIAGAPGRIVTFTSLGADGKRGGAQLDADIALSSSPYVPDAQPGKSPEGIQTQLARALRVRFQLNEMDTSRPGWINADMDINQLQHALAAQGEEDAMILQMLEGESISAKIAGFVLGFIARSPQLSSMMKLVLMDMLALVETTGLLEQQEAIDAVIVKGRNAVVIDTLKEVMREHPEHKDIGIFYGAGHMADLEGSLREMGYAPQDDAWTAAMTVRTKDTGLSDAQVRMMRAMIKSSLEQQLSR